MPFIGAGSVQLFGDRSGRFGVELNEIRIVAGRRADPAAADEVVISKAIADRVGLAPGSVLQVSLFTGDCCLADPSEWQTPVTLRVVGIGLAPGEVPPPSGDYLRDHPPHACLRRRAGAFWARTGAPLRSR